MIIKKIQWIFTLSISQVIFTLKIELSKEMLVAFIDVILWRYILDCLILCASETYNSYISLPPLPM